MILDDYSNTEDINNWSPRYDVIVVGDGCSSAELTLVNNFALPNLVYYTAGTAVTDTYNWSDVV